MRGRALRLLLMCSISFLQASCRVETRICTYYNDYSNNDPVLAVVNGTENCSLAHPGRRNFECVFGVTINASGTRSNRVGSCVFEYDDCTVNECVLKKTEPTPNDNGNHHYLCCCKGDLCNSKIVGPEPSTPPVIVQTTGSSVSEDPSTSSSPTSGSGQRVMVIIVVAICVGFLIVTFLIILPIWYWCVCHRTSDCEIDREDIEISLIRASSIDLLSSPGANQPGSLKFIDKIGSGRFAEVWRGKFLSENVAVKIFYEGERPSWLAEVNTYVKPMMLRHSSLLRFWFAEKRYGDSGPEYLLITDYHPKGSLCDFLKENVIHLDDMCMMGSTLAAGMTYLHTRIVSSDGVKPVIAHRDIKSRNVLIKQDHTCCISDFGLAIKFKHGEKATEAHGQVGTIRYMAPEVLEGAICFQEQSFLRTDMYAVALVMWEMASRCVIGKNGVRPYQQPYEAEIGSHREIGSHPSVEQMLDIVVVEKLRPAFGPEWDNREPLETIRETIEECWDCEGEARLTAQCLEERLKQCQQLLHHFNQPQVVELPPETTAEDTSGSSSIDTTPWRAPKLTGVTPRGIELPNGTDTHPIWPNSNGHNPVNGTHTYFYQRGILSNGFVPQNGIIERRSPTKATNMQLFSPLRHVFVPPPPEASSSSCPPPYSPTPEATTGLNLKLVNGKETVTTGNVRETSL